MKKRTDEPPEPVSAPRKSEAKRARELGELYCRRQSIGMGVTRDYTNYFFQDSSSAHFPRRA